MSEGSGWDGRSGESGSRCWGAVLDCRRDFVERLVT